MNTWVVMNLERAVVKAGADLKAFCSQTSFFDCVLIAHLH